MSRHWVDYHALAGPFWSGSMAASTLEERRSAFAAFLLEHLPGLWCDSYRQMPNGRGQIVEVKDQGYQFLFDLGAERVVAVYGTSRYQPARRDSGRMGGFLDKARSKRQLDSIAQRAPSQKIGLQRQQRASLSWRERFFETHGDRYDRGHFMSHRQGGGLDINLFPQRTDINQGRSALGQQYRTMERHCVNNTTFCFSRPAYDDDTWAPAELDYGYMEGAQLTVRRFPNK